MSKVAVEETGANLYLIVPRDKHIASKLKGFFAHKSYSTVNRIRLECLLSAIASNIPQQP